ncbi:ectonucleoside triphosphate diphosphohydrolase 5-like [Acanthaster planci]|uniref:Ectonucleoside triphosphate diphosphohydrolase 5-like n=1 Tax=Acanthaster planci TaxID=133434 RepID=A0A8B7YQS9_ACAPL|nr:ectonucleoside triphosphate diphosphohydrolase 5-like [Acanthaster planci]
MALMQVRPNYKLISVLVVVALTLFLVFTSMYNGGTTGRASLPGHKALLSSTRGWQAGSLPMLSSDDVAWSELFQESLVKNDFYGVMFDAGSTGSRVHIFHFQNDFNGGPPVLIAEVFNKTEHGLGEFADSPQKAVESVRGLLNVATESIPSEFWASTPVALKATAGLRLLPLDKAQSLLDAVYQLFVQSPFLVDTQNNTVTIIDGIHEGEYIWFTVNFLRGILGTQDHSSNTMGVLDLGGGSTQITFAPRHQETIDEGMPLGLIKQFKFREETFQLYTHSYLGLGLKEARLETLRLEQQMMASVPSSTQAHRDSDTNWATVCLPPNAEASWEFAGVTHVTKSANGPEVTDTFTPCADLTKRFMGDKVYRPKEIANRTFYSSSYFLGKSVESGLITREFGGIVRVKEFTRVAKEACRSFDASNPFLCMDLVYIHTLLRHGYDFKAETELVMNERIRGFEISWALGATIDLLHSHWDKYQKSGNL